MTILTVVTIELLSLHHSDAGLWKPDSESLATSSLPVTVRLGAVGLGCPRALLSMAPGRGPIFGCHRGAHHFLFEILYP
eukprot:3303880-Rhodomonas_salina.1